MDERVKKIDTPEKCMIFEKNARNKGREDLANQAILRSTELRAQAYGAGTLAEKEALQAVFAYEETLRAKHGRKIRANRTWQMIERHGIVEAVNRAVNRPTETQGYQALFDMGLSDYAFESVIVRHPDVFSKEALTVAQNRIKEWS